MRCLHWGDFWEDLEKLEHSLAYKDRVLMHKQVEVQGGFKNLKPPKKKGSEVKESGRGGAVGGGGKVNRGGRQGAQQGRITATVVALGNTGQTVVTT